MVNDEAIALGSQERRARERVETRQRILEAAREMFVRDGYEATTMRAIAQRIEYTPTAIYHHFKNKESLFTELCQLDFRSLASAFERVARIEDPVHRLRELGWTYVDFALEHPMQYQLMFMVSRPRVDDSLPNAHVDPGETAYSMLRETCAAAIASGRLRAEYQDPSELGQMVWAALHGLLALHIVKQQDDWIEWRDTRTTARRICDALLVGVLLPGAG